MSMGTQRRIRQTIVQWLRRYACYVLAIFSYECFTNLLADLNAQVSLHDRAIIGKEMSCHPSAHSSSGFSTIHTPAIAGMKTTRNEAVWSPRVGWPGLSEANTVAVLG